MSSRGPCSLQVSAENTTLVLSADSDLFKFPKGIDPKGDVVPPVRSTEIQ